MPTIVEENTQWDATKAIGKTGYEGKRGVSGSDFLLIGKENMPFVDGGRRPKGGTCEKETPYRSNK